MMGPWKSAAGMLELELTSAQPAAALAAAAARGIPVFHGEEAGALSVRLQIYRRDFRKLAALCEKRGERLQILRHRGVYWTAKAMLRRPVLLVSLSLLLFGLLYLPTHVYFIRVEGNRTVPEHRILEGAEACGIRFGASRRGVRSEKMKNALLEEIPELEWAGVNTRGCVATISVRERTPETPPEFQGEWGGIVAAMDGVIRSCTVLSGNGLCQVGQAVRKGELLVSGYTDYGICIRSTPAKAEIFADTHREFTAVTPGKRTARGKILRSETKYSLLFGKKRINFYKGSGILEGSCVKMIDEKKLTLPGGFVLPVSLVKERWVRCETEQVAVSPEDAGRLLEASARACLLRRMVAGQILRQDTTLSQTDGGYCLRGEYACLEMIGRGTSWETWDSYG